MKPIEKRRPGGDITKRTSKVIFLCDTSGSMEENGKIDELNNCLREAVPHIKKIGEETPNANIEISILSFDSTPKWLTQNESIQDFVWKDLKANSNGETNIGQAFSLLAMEMDSNSMPERGYPPLIVVITDGNATDSYNIGLDEFHASKWGQKAVRRAIAIGKEADMSVLVKFINNREIPPILANNPEQLAKAIRFLSTAVLKKVSTPQTGEGPNLSPEFEQGTDEDIW